MKKIQFILLGIVHALGSLSQNVSITNDGSAPDPAAMLDIKSSTKGLLIPRMTQAQRTAINPAPQGLIVYQTDGASGLYYNASSLPAFQNWYKLINSLDQYWAKTLSGDHMYNTNTGNIGIGNTFPVDAGLVVTAMGQYALRSNTSGNFNVALGTVFSIQKYNQ